MGPYLSSPITQKNSIQGENSRLKFACTSMQGWRTSMEDAHICELDFDDKKECSIFGVLDGHGGKEAAIYVGQNFVQVLKSNENFKKRNIELSLKETFMEIDRMMQTKEGQTRLIEIKIGSDNKSDIEFYSEEKSSAGCTANIAMIYNGYLYVANCGDSRAIINKGGKVIKMSYDHKPDQQREKSRIQKAGGFVSNDGRINGNLNLSRSIGDFGMKNNDTLGPEEQMVICVPDIMKKKIQPEDKFLLMGCDGIWETMSDLQISSFIESKLFPNSSKNSKKNNSNKSLPNYNQSFIPIIESLLDTAIAPFPSQGFGCDNMSSILVVFKP